jgi:hypothetical protein
METAKKNFKRMMEFLKSQDYIEITTFNDLMERFSHQKDFITKQDLKNYAEAVLEKQQVIYDPYFSPAEMMQALTGSLEDFISTGKLPAKIARMSPLGPMELPETSPDISMITNDQAKVLARIASQWIRDQGYLPEYIILVDKFVGTGSLLALFCEMYLDILAGQLNDSYEITSFDPWPMENEQAIISQVEDCKSWPVHKRDLDMTRIVQLTRLQLWTIKPAMEK